MESVPLMISVEEAKNVPIMENVLDVPRIPIVKVANHVWCGNVVNHV